MEIAQNPLTTTANPTTANPTAANAQVDVATTPLSSDFEVFLQMLTAQMKYQDPLNPVDSTDYATQLATFSGVEQAVLTNDLLRALTDQMTVGGLTDIASWVGREARSTAPVYFDGQPVEIYPQKLGASDSQEIIVRNASGTEVQRLPFVPGSESIVWTGASPGGTPLPDGNYNFQVVGKSNGQVVSQAGVETYSKVSEVRIDGGQTVIILQGGADIPSNKVTALRDL